jgi:TPR repeat protein
MRWALTQLGSIFASPEGFEPDFVKARMLWEVAGGLGDPVALCFNASLYEHGLGVTRHKDLARALYERARTAGGCSGIDDAISRTK